MGEQAQHTRACFYIRSDVSTTQQDLSIRVGGKVFGKCLSEVLEYLTLAPGQKEVWPSREKERKKSDLFHVQFLFSSLSHSNPKLQLSQLVSLQKLDIDVFISL